MYGQRHLLQLLLIRSLARRGLSLTAIAPLAACSDGELLEQLRHLEEPSSPPPTSEQQEALAYLQSMQPERSPSLLPLLGAPLSGTNPPPSPRRSLTACSASSRWYRFSLAPGV